MNGMDRLEGPAGSLQAPHRRSDPVARFPQSGECVAGAALEWARFRLSCENVLKEKVERLVEVDMGNPLFRRASNPRRLKHRKFREALAPETRWRRSNRHNSREEADPLLTAFGQSHHNIQFTTVDDIRVVFSAADRGKRGCRDPGMCGFGA